MFWFNKKDPRTIYIDNRIEIVTMADSSAKNGYQTMIIKPDIKADFMNLPFVDNSFSLVVFDPPHLIGSGENCWLTKRYGRLKKDWEFTIAKGFSECFRVLNHLGTLIFKWNETDITVKKILSLTNELPLFGHKSGKSSKTHWISFLKE